jgi:hypothetical protein
MWYFCRSVVAKMSRGLRHNTEPMDVKHVAQELGVRPHLLEGGVRKAGNRVPRTSPRTASICAHWRSHIKEPRLLLQGALVIKASAAADRCRGGRVTLRLYTSPCLR